MKRTKGKISNTRRDSDESSGSRERSRNDLFLNKDVQWCERFPAWRPKDRESWATHVRRQHRLDIRRGMEPAILTQALCYRPEEFSGFQKIAEAARKPRSESSESVEQAPSKTGKAASPALQRGNTVAKIKDAFLRANPSTASQKPNAAVVVNHQQRKPRSAEREKMKGKDPGHSNVLVPSRKKEVKKRPFGQASHH